MPLNRLELPIKRLHREVCAALHDAILGDLTHQFIVINIPPRVGKTKMMEALACWGLGYFPDMQIIYTSYANDLACQSSRYVQAIVASPWYQELFPRTQLGAIQQADHFTTDRGGVVYADGVGGSLTGRGAGLKRRAGGFIIVDDPSKPNEALSRIESEKVRFWFENTLKSRRNSSQWTPIIVCMQRLDADDLSGFLLENYPKDTLHLKFPAMVDEQSVIPETVTTESLEDTRRVNPFTYAAQYQQEPVVFGGNLIKLEDFRYYQWGHAPQVELKVFTCDTALRAKTSSDWSVIQCWGRAHRQAYLLDQVRGKWEPAELLKNFAAFWRKHHVRGSPVAYAAVEESGTGQTLVPELRKLGIPARGLMRTRDKVTRVMEALPYQATGMVLLPKGAPWLGSFEAELATFRKDGKSRHDDQCLVVGTRVLARHRAASHCGRWTAIEDITTDFEVMTRKGWRRVLWGGQTGTTDRVFQLRTTNDRVLLATGNHPVWTANRGFNRIDSITDGDTVQTWPFQKQSNLGALSFAGIPRVASRRTGTIIAHIRDISAAACSISIRKFGKCITVAPYQPGMLSIIATAIRSTMPWITSKLSLKGLIWSNTALAATGAPTDRNSSLCSTGLDRRQSAGTRRPQDSSGIGSTANAYSPTGLESIVRASTAAKRCEVSIDSANFAATYVKDAIGELSRTNIRVLFVSNAPSPSPSSGANSAVQTAHVSSVLEIALERPVAVFNLKVEDEPEFYANGILVHNCDAFADGVTILLGKGTSILQVLGSRK